MVRTTITPDHANIAIDIPESYIGKQVEILVYTIDEVEQKRMPEPTPIIERKKASDFKGILSAEMVEQYQEHIKRSREEWQHRF